MPAVFGQEAGHTRNWLPANRRAPIDKQPFTLTNGTISSDHLTYRDCEITIVLAIVISSHFKCCLSVATLSCARLQMRLLGECRGNIDTVKRMGHELKEEEDTAAGLANPGGSECQTSGESARRCFDGISNWITKGSQKGIRPPPPG